MASTACYTFSVRGCNLTGLAGSAPRINVLSVRGRLFSGPTFGRDRLPPGQALGFAPPPRDGFAPTIVAFDTSCPSPGVKGVIRWSRSSLTICATYRRGALQVEDAPILFGSILLQQPEPYCLASAYGADEIAHPEDRAYEFAVHDIAEVHDCLVVARTAIYLVALAVASDIDGVVVFPTLGRIPTWASSYLIVAIVADEEVVVDPANQRVGAISSAYGILTIVPAKLVIARVTDEPVVAAVAPDQVVACAGTYFIVAGASPDSVVAGGAPYYIVAIGSRERGSHCDPGS